MGLGGGVVARAVLGVLLSAICFYLSSMLSNRGSPCIAVWENGEDYCLSILLSQSVRWSGEEIPVLA